MTFAIPSVAEELEEFLADDGKIKQLFNENGSPKPEFGEFLKNYATAHAKRDQDDVNRQIKEQTQLAVSEMVKSQHGGLGKVHFAKDNTAGAVPIPGAKANDVFENHGEFLQAIYSGRDRLPNAAQLNQKLNKLREVQSSFGTLIPSDGGFLVPGTLTNEIMTIALESSLIRPLATIIPMTSAKVSIPAVDDTDHSSDTVFGGVACYWEGEGATMTDTDADFQAIDLEAHWLTVLSTVPDNLPEDAPAFLAWFMSRMPEALAWKEDTTFIDGSGAKRPQGFLNGPGVVSVARETGQSSGGDPGLNTIVAENLDKAFSRMLPASLKRAVWIANINTFPQLVSMARSVGTGGAPVWVSNMAGTPPMTIYGRPVLFTEKVPTLGAQGDIGLYDLSYYAIGDRRTLRLDSSVHSKFTSNKTQYKLTERADGRPLVTSALTPRKGSSTLSPFVNLAQRSS